MNNEIGRKITSLTLMTIMVAGGLTFAAPGMMPAAHAANANLFVSAENSQFDNYMSGPQVIEVVIIDPDVNDTDESKGEPDVTVNGKKLRMVQATDGNWYGYFADKKQASIADNTARPATVGQGLDFGTFCAKNSAVINSANFFSETVGFALPFTGISVGSNGTATGTGTFATCAANSLTGATNGTAGIAMNVVREAKSVNINSNVDVGQIGISTSRTAANVDGVWPIVQLYNLNPTGNVVVQYNKGGGAQTTTLTFDTVDNFAGIELDRTKYPRNAQVHTTITDLWLNIDPTDEDSWTWGASTTNSTTFYQLFDENGAIAGDGTGITSIHATLSELMCEDNCILKLNPSAQGETVLLIQNNTDTQITGTTAATAATIGTTISAGSLPLTFVEQGPNSGIFGSYDESDTSVLKITSDANRGKSASIDYNETPTTILVGFEFATIDIQPTDNEWNSGEEIPVVLVDADANKNSRADEDIDLFNSDNDLIPSLRTGDPFTIGEVGTGDSTSAKSVFINWPSITFGTNNTGVLGAVTGANVTTDAFSVQTFSQRALATVNSTEAASTVNALIIDFNTNGADFKSTVKNNQTGTSGFNGFNLLNIDIRSLTTTGTVDAYLLNTTSSGSIISAANDGNVTHGVDIGVLGIANDVNPQSLSLLNKTAIFEIFQGSQLADSDKVGLALVTSGTFTTSGKEAFVADFFSFGFENDGVEDAQRIQNQIIRLELEETGDNTSTFEGSLEFIMINQLNVLDPDTYTDISPIADDPSFIVFEDRTDEDSPRVNYLDLGSDGVSTQVSDQQEAPSHSGVVSFDANNYKIADTVTITLEDADLNVDSDLIDIFTVVTTPGSDVQDKVGKDGLPNFSFGDLGRLLDVTFDDVDWKTPTDQSGSTTDCQSDLEKLTSDTGLGATGFTLVETGTETGVFIGDFQIPSSFCRSSTVADPESTTGLDIEVNYVDFRDASGEIIEVGDSAGVRANTGSVSLDRTVYPVPFGKPADFGRTSGTTPDSDAIFPIHSTGISGGDTIATSGRTLSNGDLIIHVRVNDPDFDISASGEDTIAQAVSGTDNTGPVKVSVIRGSSTVVLGYAGGPSANSTGLIDAGPKFSGDNTDNVRQFGPMEEIAPDAGIFEADVVIRYTDGPSSTSCPDTTDYSRLDGNANTSTDPDTSRFDIAGANGDYCVLQGDILQVEYTDPADASGDPNTVTDSATFDLRNGVLQSDKSVYIIGSDMILTLIEPDLDLDNDQAETWDLDLIEWDSDAATVSMGDAGGEDTAFDPEPTDFRETGDSTGIFQIVIEIPEVLDNDRLERGEEIVLEYTDWGPSGADYVGEEEEDVNLTIYTSNFGATVELDQKVYSWTDKVYITIVAPDHNFDSDLVDDIGDTDLDPIKVSTRGQSLDRYKLVETGTDTGIFTGEVILTGFSSHDADGDGDTGDALGITGDGSGKANGIGPTNGFLRTSDDDGITVSFEFSEDETVVGSALIRWNIGEVQWLEASYPATGTGVVRIIDPDMNLDPEAVDNFDVDVWSDSDAGGIDLTVTETNEATGIFEGTVFFTVNDESSGHRLRVAEGDTVTAEYEDNTLPDPYTTADELDVTATSLIGTVVPPLERAPAANLRTVDAFGNSLDTVNVDQQVQITADLANGQDREQAFAYLVQIQDANGVTVSLAWITGSLSPGQSFSPALSWIPTTSGTYTATAFVWESVDNPTALSPPVTTTITVS